MGPPETKVKQAFSATESGHQSGTIDGLTVKTAKISDEQNQLAHGKTSSSLSSSSSGSPFELDVTSNSGLSMTEFPFPNNDDDIQLASEGHGYGVPGHETHLRLASEEHGHGIPGPETHPGCTSSWNDTPTQTPPTQMIMEPRKNDEGTQLASEDNEYGISGHQTRPSYTSSSKDSPIQSPPQQKMTEPPDEPTTSAYRIPSSVFAPSRSSAPMEWSTASNESLFSIHMGNMSFTRDQAIWFKSGELGIHGEPVAMSPVMDFSSNQHLSNQPPTNRSPESGQQNARADPHFGVTESKAAETMREVIKENEVDHANKEKSMAKASGRSASFRGSDASANSIKSFAFPILTGDHKVDSSPQKRVISQPQTPKVAQEQELHQEKAKPETNAIVAQTRWFSCFPCCTSCS